MPKSKRQKENVEVLLKLIADNPTLDIMPMVDSEIVADDGSCWWGAGWGKASIDEVWSDDEHLYIRSQDEDSLVENMCDDIGGGILSDDEAYKKATEIVAAYEWERCIVAWITTP